MTKQPTIFERIYTAEKGFNSVNNYKMIFAKEAHFALQALKSNDYLCRAAEGNPGSLESALINIASIGITLNPAMREAYLVPRGGKVCLDISYIGLVRLAIETGAIVWVQADIVKEKDEFIFRGLGEMPLHKMNPFGDRGEIVGVYCVARLPTGETLSTIMSKSECEYIREKSSQSSKSGPWATFPEEMYRKTVIKRASKLWPRSERLDGAVSVLNDHEGIDFKKEQAYVAQPREMELNQETFDKLRELLLMNGKNEEGLLKYINGKFGAEISAIEEMSKEHVEESLRAMGAK
jgi:phage RecT family recombinase